MLCFWIITEYFVIKSPKQEVRIPRKSCLCASLDSTTGKPTSHAESILLVAVEYSDINLVTKTIVKFA